MVPSTSVFRLPPSALRIADWGLVPFAEAAARQRELHAAIADGRAPETLVFCEHPPTFTVGSDRRPEHWRTPVATLRARGFAVCEADRGGAITYHGPGQVVGWPLLRLARWGEDRARYLRVLEACVIEALARFGVTGERRAGATGVWVGGAKICAIGVRVARGVARHGFALNVNNDLAPFALVVPCGLPEAPVTSLARVRGRAVDPAPVRAMLAERVQAAAAVPRPAADLPVAHR